jgi:hypothetical protein
MPTARELLDQADALMRRNRKRGKDHQGDVPTLTDPLDSRAASLAPTLVLPDSGATEPIVLDDVVALDDPIAPNAAVEPTSAAADGLDTMSLDTLGDLPVLTDAVVDWPGDTNAGGAGEGADAASSDGEPPVDAGEAFPRSAQEAEAAAAELPAPAVLEREASEEAPATSSSGEQTPPPATPPRVPFLDDDFILEIPPAEQAKAVTAVPPPLVDAATLNAGTREWDALAEEIRMQVLQRLDLFTDTGLREQLGARLAPIVARASAQLIETINRELGELVRGYVAEAIEREIDSWRNQNPK